MINQVGLSTGLACVLLVYLWVSDELSVDKFHEKDSHLYQVMHNRQQNNDIFTQDYTPSSLAKALVEEIPEVEYATSVNTLTGLRGQESFHMKITT